MQGHFLQTRVRNEFGRHEEDLGNALKSRLISDSHPTCSMKKYLGTELSTSLCLCFNAWSTLLPWLANSYSPCKGPAQLFSLQSSLVLYLFTCKVFHIMIITFFFPTLLQVSYLFSRINRLLNVSPTSDSKILLGSHFSTLHIITFFSQT